MNAPQSLSLQAFTLLHLDLSVEASPTEAGLQIDPELTSSVPDLSNLIQSADHPSLIAVKIAVFSDGRAHTVAMRLRRDLGFTGGLRAVGDVGVDHLHYLARVGFDAFLLRQGTNVDDARAALTRFPKYYVGVQTQSLTSA